MANADLNIRIKQVLEGGNVMSNLNKEIRQVESELARLKLQGLHNSNQFKELQGTYKGLISTKQNLRNEFRQMTGASKVSGESMLAFAGKVGLVVGAVTIAIAGIAKLGSELLDVAKKGAEFNILKKGFDELSGGTEQSKKSLELFGKALAGNLDNKKIMEFANSFRLLGESDDEIAKFFDIAESRTELFGGDIETAINALQRFVETGNKKGGLALKFDVNALEKEMARLGNTSVENLKKFSDEDQQLLRKQAIYNVYGKSIDDINNKKKDEADAIQFLFTQYENLKTAILSNISTALAPMITIAQQAIDKFKEMFGGLTNGNSAIGKFTQQIIHLVQEGFEYFVNIWSTKVWPVYQQLLKAINDYLSKNPQFITALKAVGKAFIDLGAFVAKFYVNFVVALVQGIDWVTGAFKTLLGWIDSIGKAFASVIPNTWIESIKSAIQWIKNAISDFGEWIKDKWYIRILFPWTNAFVGDTQTEIKSDNYQVKPGDYNVPLPPKKDDFKAPKMKSSGSKTEKEKEKDVIADTIKEIEEYVKNLELTNKLSAKELQTQIEKLDKISLETLSLEKQNDVLEEKAKLQEQINKLEEDKQKQQEYNKNLLAMFEPKSKEKENQSFGGGGKNILTNSEHQEPAKAVEKLEVRFEDLIHNITGLAQNEFIAALLGGVDSFGVALLGFLSQAIDTVGQIVSIITSIASLLSGGGFLSIFGFAEGGYTGTGGKYQPAGIVHRGEYVFPQESVNKLGIPFLNWLSGSNGSLSWLTGSYANGGLVGGMATPNITVIVESEVEKTKAQRFYMNTFADYQNRMNKKSL